MYAYLCIELGNMNCCIDKLTVYTAMFYEYLKLHVNFQMNSTITLFNFCVDYSCCILITGVNFPAESEVL